MQGSLHAPEHVKNRRWLVKEGSAVSTLGDIDQAKMHPLGGSPDLIKLAGPVNDKFSYLAFREPTGEVIAFYAFLQPTLCGNGRANTSICRLIRCLLRDELGQGLSPKATSYSKPFVAALSNGTLGDINKNDYSKAIPKTKRCESIHQMAQDLVFKTEESLKKIQWTDSAPLAVSLDFVELRYRVPTPELVEKSKKILQNTPEVLGKVSLPRIDANRVSSFDATKIEVKVPVQVLRISDTIIGIMPGEIFSET